MTGPRNWHPQLWHGLAWGLTIATLVAILAFTIGGGFR